MIEKRKHNRVVMNTTISAKAVGEKGLVSENDFFDIDIFDISVGGIGFHSSRLLPLNSFYDANIVLLNGEKFNCVIKIVRGFGSNIYTYGAEFVSLSPTDSYRLELYSMIIANDPHAYDK